MQNSQHSPQSIQSSDKTIGVLVGKADYKVFKLVNDAILSIMPDNFNSIKVVSNDGSISVPSSRRDGVTKLTTASRLLTYLNNLSYIKSVNVIGISKSTVLSSGTVILTPILSFILLNEYFNGIELTGIAITIIGLVIYFTIKDKNS